MRHKIFAPVVVMSALALGQQAHAGTLTISAINASVTGGGVITGNLTLTWGATTDAVYDSSNSNGTGYKITGISGMISDSSSNINITNEPVSPTHPYALNLWTPSNNPLAPADFSYNPVEKEFTYDNLVWPGGSAVVCSGFNSSGTLLDVFGVLFTLKNGDYVDLWGNGLTGGLEPGFPFTPGGYGIGIYDPKTGHEDYLAAGVILTVPEPGTWAMAGLGFLGLGLAGLRRTRRPAEVAAP